MENKKYNPNITPEVEKMHKMFLKNPKLGRGNSTILKGYKEILPELSPFQKEAAIGLTLGDNSLQKRTKNADWKMKFQYSKTKHPEYAAYVHNIYKHWILTEPKDIVRNTGQVNLGFETIGHKNFNFLGELFMSTGKKAVPKNLIKNHLTPVGLAFWFQDDGGKTDYGKNSGKGIDLHTQGFTEEEVETMALELSEKFGIKAWKVKNKGKWIIRISGSDYEKVVSLIDPYLIPETRKKLPSPRKIN